MNILLIGIIIVSFSALIFWIYQHQHLSHQLDGLDETQEITTEVLIEKIKIAIQDITRSNLHELGLSPSDYNRSLNKRAELLKALKNCTHGSLQDKRYVKDILFDLLHRDVAITPKSIQRVIPFDYEHLLTAQDKFDILLYTYRKRFNQDALGQMIQRYSLDSLKTRPTGERAYAVTTADIERIYTTECPVLTYEEQLEIVTQRIYQKYKGFSVIDEIRDMSIDGVSGGVSGALKEDTCLEGVFATKDRHPLSHESVWVYYQGKSIHFDFLKFDSEIDLRRVCHNIYRYNNIGMLSHDVGYKINEMVDGSRVVVVRPSFSESWAFFVRKFQTQKITLDLLIKDNHGDLTTTCIRYLAKGARITAITGAQGSGKTTLLMAMVGEIYGSLTLRIQEMAFELNLRKIYPYRNIVTFRETDVISGQEGLNVQKKTDGAVNILGEVASDSVAAWMIQMAQVASLFTLFTHHAKTCKDLILSLRNSLLKCDVFRDEKVAEEQVVNVINFNIHLAKTHEGKRYIERITEIIPIEPGQPYPIDYRNPDASRASFMDTTTEFYTRITDRKTYLLRNIIEYRCGSYYAVNPISHLQVEEMKSHMTDDDSLAFVEYITQWWGSHYVRNA